MSNIEIALVVGICLAPVLALFFVLPKKLKKEKKQALPTTEYKPEPSIVDEKPAEEPKEVQSEMVENKGVVIDEFKNYMQQKKNRVTSPIKIEPPDDIFTEEYIPSRLRRKKTEKENKTIIEQIEDLSPELKALLLAGVLDKKDFD